MRDEAIPRQIRQRNLTAELDSYILERGFPRALYYETPQDKRIYAATVIAEIFEKDVRKRVKVKNVSVFNQAQAYIFHNFGATTSLTNILQDLAKPHNLGLNVKELVLKGEAIMATETKSRLADMDSGDLYPPVAWRSLSASSVAI